ncbi:MAG: dienelactone hydrolase family protein [Anaerolineae bacterium]|nr:dienelactone hydrolase family protein [Anaerolineae bacterium]
MNHHPTSINPHQGQQVMMTGQPLNQATAAMILVHGRGATATSILELAAHLPHPEMAYLAPQAAGYTWYPYSFLYPLEQNEPYLSSALQRLADLVSEIEAANIPVERLILAGFSQGACLASEFVARNPRRYGALLAFSGGVIGPPGTPRNYAGSLAGTPVFLGCSDIDSHIPKERVQETAAVLTSLGAAVTMRLYPGMDHTIIADELVEANKIVGKIDLLK